jgi:hypothetical protein
MAKLILNGSTSGSISLESPAVSGTTTLTLPANTGTVVVTSGAQTIEFADGSASTPSITNSGDTNTGMFFPAADTIAFAENGTESMRLTDTGLLQFNSGYGSVATAYGCRAWVNFNGTGTPAIRASGNVTSITDQGVGLYAVNFTTAMPDVSYSYSHAYSNEVNAQHTVGFLNTMSTSQLSIAHYNAANSANAADKSFVLIAVFR